MAKGKRRARGKVPEFAPLVKSEPPDGAEVIEGGASGFYNFEREGQQVQGVLMGTSPIQNTRGEMVGRYNLLLESGDVVILPDHYDLAAKLAKLLEATPPPVRVWIQYRGKRAANVISGYIQVYEVARLAAVQQPLGV